MCLSGILPKMLLEVIHQKYWDPWYKGFLLSLNDEMHRYIQSPVLFFLPFLSLLAALFMAMENEKKINI